jgi:UDP-N-acetylglucosamine--N-acetylmuramyl-(pentapeptide) pyrophosphoryl-undecaprenol N-acetylglucosamine transferase
LTTDSESPASHAARPFDFGGERVLFVASTGGHLSELYRLAPAMNADPGSRWVTFDSAQSRSLLAGRRVTHVRYIRPRDLRATWLAVAQLVRVLRAERPVAVVSTGAGVAVSAFLAARLLLIPTRYVESVSRTGGPSLTGRIVRTLRLARTYTQQASWADETWRPYPSVLSEFESVPRHGSSSKEPRLFVTLGTIDPYRFDALVDAVLATGLAAEDTVWQLGSTSRTDLPGRVFDLLDTEEFGAACGKADVVITHAGVGTILTLLESGIHPVVVPRRSARAEHVDDHQCQIASHLRDKGIAEVREVEDLTAAALRAAARRRIRTVPVGS